MTIIVNTILFVGLVFLFVRALFYDPEWNKEQKQIKKNKEINKKIEKTTKSNYNKIVDSVKNMK